MNETFYRTPSSLNLSVSLSLDRETNIPSTIKWSLHGTESVWVWRKRRHRRREFVFVRGAM